MLIPNTQHLDWSLGNPENSVEWAQQIVPPTNSRLTSSGDRHDQKGFSLHAPLKGLAMKVVANHFYFVRNDWLQRPKKPRFHCPLRPLSETSLPCQQKSGCWNLPPIPSALACILGLLRAAICWDLPGQHGVYIFSTWMLRRAGEIKWQSRE